MPALLNSTDTTIFRRQEKLMGNSFELTVAARTEKEAFRYMDDAVSEIRRIERLLTTFSEESETSMVNRQAGIAPVKVSKEFLELVKRSVMISDLTQGAFDITYGSADKRFWNFDVHMKELPDATVMKNAVRLVDYRNVEIDEAGQTVFLREKGMRIGFGGIGKGYAAERVRSMLKAKGVTSGVINAAGDLTTWGHRPDGSPWTIGIANPLHRQTAFSWVEISDMAVATSGNYEKYAIIGGRRYSHTIDPRTGYPVSGIKSVTIICPNGEIADAMATPVMIMGVDTGLHLVNQVKGLACIIVDDQDRVHLSDNVKIPPV